MESISVKIIKEGDALNISFIRNQLLRHTIAADCFVPL